MSGVVGRINQIHMLRAARKTKHITSKLGNRLFYKGRGCWKGGFHTKKGGYVINETKMKFIVVPDLNDFKLGPYVANDTPMIKVPPPKEHKNDSV